MYENIDKVNVFLTALTDCYKDEEDRDLSYYEKLNNGQDVTNDFYAMVEAFFVFYIMLTGDRETDLLGFTHLLNRIVVQNISKERED